MEIIQSFSDELQSLADCRPPVSKAKMGLITRAAMKGVKYYKHIVQTVEKFISRCRPEYKVPGLYVIDSIVRQSRHQFGCVADDKPKIVRVLNLWQKNGVFNAQVIQPLLDMANPNSNYTFTQSALSADSPDLELNKRGHSSKYRKYNNNNNDNQYNRSPKQPRNNEFDYDQDEENNGDETPTEAEPPLSSTLNKIEMEQRNRNDMSGSTKLTHHRDGRSTGRNDQDAVLERWNKLVEQQSVSGDNTNDTSTSTHKRSRSRSPASPVSAPGPMSSKMRSIPSIQERSKPKPKPEAIFTLTAAEREAERKAERQKKCLPEMRDKHVTVCSTTLWLGHVPKTVSEADISDAFGEFGTITSIDLIPPRGCAYVCMDRRQDAKKALSESKDLRLNGSQVKMAWAPGKGLKENKKLKDFWEVDIGASYIPYNKIDALIDFDVLEEGGVIDEDSMSIEMRDRRDRRSKEKNDSIGDQDEPVKLLPNGLALPLPVLPILNQPPPTFSIPPPTNLSIPPPISMAVTGIGFPPPSVVPTSLTGAVSASNLINSHNQQKNVYSNALNNDAHTGKESYQPTNSQDTIDQQISMTQHQITMVEQQLNMMQRQHQIHQGTNLYTQTQHNPLMFDMSVSNMIHGTNTSISDPNHQMPFFANPEILAQQPLLPVSQAGLGLNTNMNGAPHYGGHF